MEKKSFKEKALGLIPSFVSIIIGLFLGWFILFVTNPADSFAGIGTVLLGGFNEGKAGIGNVLYAATPIILTGLSVGFGMKTGLFNIGASGQFTVGAFVAIFVGVKFTFLPAVVHSAVAIILGVLAGALWGYIAGINKAYFRVNEVISGIMLNYIAMLLTNLLIKNYIYDSKFTRSAMIAPSAEISRNLFDFILPGCNISIAFFIAVLVALGVKKVIDRTTFGYELKTTGRNSFVANAAGINTQKSTALTLTISGALAGLGGALMFLSDFGDHIAVNESVLSQGFTGISVALLGLSDPIGIIFAGLFIAYITVGGSYLQLFSYTPDVVDMIVAVVVFCGAFVAPIRSFIKAVLNKKHRTDEEGMV